MSLVPEPVSPNEEEEKEMVSVVELGMNSSVGDNDNETTNQDLQKHSDTTTIISGDKVNSSDLSKDDSFTTVLLDQLEGDDEVNAAGKFVHQVLLYSSVIPSKTPLFRLQWNSIHL